jgi:hypothetical protein
MPGDDAAFTPGDDEEALNLSFGNDLQPDDFTGVTGKLHTDWKGTQSYFYSSGIIQLPVASDDDSGEQECELVRVCAPYSRRIVSFTAECEGTPADIPDALEDINENETLLSSTVVTAIPPPNTQMRYYVYRTSGRYIYASKKPWRPTASNGGLSGEPHRFGQLPSSYIAASMNGVNCMANVHFVTGIAEPLSPNDDDSSVISEMTAAISSGGDGSQFSPG